MTPYDPLDPPPIPTKGPILTKVIEIGLLFPSIGHTLTGPSGTDQGKGVDGGGCVGGGGAG